MKLLLLVALIAAAGGAAGQSQPRAPAVGGAPLVDSGSGSEVKAARRGIMRDTLSRQYSAQEIDEYRDAIDAYERSKSGIYQEAAKVVRRRVVVGLSPDALVQEIRLNAENVGAVVFTDSLGNPWPVDDVVVPGFVTVKKIGNMVIFSPAGGGGQQANMRYGRGSITVLLAGLSSTVPFSLSYGLSREVDGQVEAQIQARNPTAAINAVQGGSIETDEVFGLFLDGEPPKEARRVKTSAKSVDAWMYMNHLYVRTSLALHSPAFRMFGSSASGVSVYRFDRVPSIINAINDGAIVAVGIGE